MHILFVHRAFPAQFGRLALELARRWGWQCSALVERLTSCPTPSQEMLNNVAIHRIALPTEGKPEAIAWPRNYGLSLRLGQTVYQAVRGLPDLRPDLVVGHGGLMPTLFLREILDCPIVDYCEYYFAQAHRDLTYRIDLPPADPAPFMPRCINAATLVNLTACDAGYSPTQWQRRSFPERFWPKIEVHFDGLDTELYRPREVPRVIAGRAIPPQTRIVTFVARGLESMRGFDLFMRIAQRISQEYRDVLFVIAGEETTHYGWDRLHTGQASFKQWVLSRSNYDLGRFIFLGHVLPEKLAEVLCLSNLHIYLTVPFVLSWSLLDALASGCVVLAGDVPPVREVIEPGVTGLIEPLFDIDRLTETALRVLRDPAAYGPLGRQARALIEERYSLDRAIPELKEFFERQAAKKV